MFLSFFQHVLSFSTLLSSTASVTHPRVNIADADKTWQLSKVSARLSTIAAERERVAAKLALAQEG